MKTTLYITIVILAYGIVGRIDADTEAALAAEYRDHTHYLATAADHTYSATAQAVLDDMAAKRLIARAE